MAANVTQNNGLHRNARVHALLIIVLGLIAYSNTLSAAFTFDDRGYITENPLIRSIGHLSGNSSLDDQNIHINVTNSLSTRYLVYLSFALNYYLHGLDVRGYHAVNILIHIINALLVYLLIRLSFKTPFLRESKASPYSGYIALFTSLVFVTHPIQTGAVTYISQRFASMCTMFYLASIASYISSRLSENRKRNHALYGLSILFAIAAMKSKEIAFTLPVAIGLYEFSFFEGERKRIILLLVPLLLTMLMIPLSLMDFSKPLSEALEGATKVSGSVSRLDYLLTQFTVITKYIRLMFLPIKQNLDYDYPLYISLFEPKVLMSFVLLMALFGLAVYLYFRSRRSEPALRLVGFGILWFFLALSVESSVMPPLNLIFEHRLYLPSAFFIASVVTGLYIAGIREGGTRAIAGLLLTAVVALSAAAYARNRVWGSELALWEDVERKSPNKARPHENLGYVFIELGRYDEAIEHLQIAIKISPSHLAYYSLGVAYMESGQRDKAIEHNLAALRYEPRSIRAINNLGVLYMDEGRLDEAIEQFEKLRRLSPDFAAAYYNLALAHFKKARLDEAMRFFIMSVELSPGMAESHYYIGKIMASRGQIDESIKSYQRAVKLNPEYGGAYAELADLYVKKGMTDMAILCYKAALELDPSSTDAFAGLVRTYKLSGRHDEAKKMLTTEAYKGLSSGRLP